MSGSRVVRYVRKGISGRWFHDDITKFIQIESKKPVSYHEILGLAQVAGSKTCAAIGEDCMIFIGRFHVTTANTFFFSAIVIVLKHYPTPCLTKFKPSIEAETLRKTSYAPSNNACIQHLSYMRP